MAINPLKLSGSLPELIAAERRFASLAAAQGIAYRIADFGGVRSAADTAQAITYRDQDYARYVAQAKATGKPVLPIDGAWDAGRPRKIAPFGTSFHNYGAAFDVRIASKPNGMTDDQALAILGSLAPSCGLRWGAEFSDQWHFELRVPLGTVKSAWEALGNQPGVSVGAMAVSVAGVLAVIGLLLFGLRKLA